MDLNVIFMVCREKQNKMEQQTQTLVREHFAFNVANRSTFVTWITERPTGE
jgi:hypothetical protein